MGKAKIAITLDEQTVGRIDRLVRMKTYPNRSRAIEEAVQEKLERMDRSRLARESAKLDPAFERALAEEGLSEELREWPEY
ncbi:MAG: ribbon-helix-helix protein, CopG family [Acidobacteria bacterium]|nr:ribbon-helix-helix protein, CopG family [Acidobacteriota bacterium]